MLLFWRVFTKLSVATREKKNSSSFPVRKFSVDPNLTSFEVLQSILCRAFELTTSDIRSACQTDLRMKTILFFSFSNLAWRLSTRNLEHNMATVSTQLEDIQEKMYDFEQNKECNLTDI